MELTVFLAIEVPLKTNGRQSKQNCNVTLATKNEKGSNFRGVGRAKLFFTQRWCIHRYYTCESSF